MIATSWSVDDTYLSIVVALLLSASAFFALSETALTRMTRSRARGLRDDARRGAEALVRLADAPERFLNPLLLLTLICQLVSATLVGVVAGDLFGPAGVIVAMVAEVVVIFVLFEAIPKNFAVAHHDRAALLSAPVVAALVGFPPVRWSANFLLAIARWVIGLFGTPSSLQRMTESEVLAMADVAHEDQAIESEERNFIHSVIEFGDTVVREVMVPRPDMVDVPSDASVRDALRLAIDSGRSRLPVLGEGVDDVIGIVNLRLLAALVEEGRGDEAVAMHASEAHFVPETKRVASLLSEIRLAQSHLVIVVDEYGGTAGLVTLEDILEELVGEITDESDVSVQVATASPGSITLSGRLNIDDANLDYNLVLPKDGWDTVGGLVLDMAGGMPEVGEEFYTEDYRITVTRLDGHRIEEVRVERLDEA